MADGFIETDSGDKFSKELIGETGKEYVTLLTVIFENEKIPSEIKMAASVVRHYQENKMVFVEEIMNYEGQRIVKPRSQSASLSENKLEDVVEETADKFMHILGLPDNKLVCVNRFMWEV